MILRLQRKHVIRLQRMGGQVVYDSLIQRSTAPLSLDFLPSTHASRTALEVNICNQNKNPMSSLLFLLAVRGLGIIGGGAVLFTASALAGQTMLPMLGEKGLHLPMPNISLKCPLLLFFDAVLSIVSTELDQCIFETCKLVLEDFSYIQQSPGLGTAASLFGGGVAVSSAMCTAPFCR